ncbi:hypothetical protein LXL04_038765 [Taraxacum kok-saghyz]
MVMCRCGSEETRTTSWSDINPGRQFWRCSRPSMSCGFVGWIDPPMCPRAVQVIPGLLRAMNMLEERERLAHEDALKMKKLLFCSWFLFLFYFFLY